jgi:REP element-mobilizing transposase RayT
MPRPPRIDIENGWHHVMNRGIDHGDTFLDDSDRIEMGQRLGDVFDRFGIQTHAYCLLDNHFHFLWHCPDGGLSAGMQRLGSLYTRHVNDRLGRDGALFRGRFHSRLIVDEAHLVATVRYIHRNALDVEGVDRVRNYRWSSHRAYLGLRTAPPWLVTDHVFRGWTPSEIDQFIERPLDAAPEVRGGDVDLLITTIELVLSERGLGSDRRLGAVARQIALAWLVGEAVLPDSALMDAFGIDRLGTLRTAISRARALLRSEPALVDVQSRAISLLPASGLHRGSDPCCNQSAARAAS